jgi:hypothetical protein
MTIDVGASGSLAEIQFTLTNNAGPIVGHSFTTGQVKLVLPGGTYGNATVANIQPRGLGLYGLQLTAGETATAGVGAIRIDGTSGSYIGGAPYESSPAQHWTFEISPAPLSAATIAAAVWAYVTEGTTTAVQAFRGITSFAMGKLVRSGTSWVSRDLADTKNVISATIISGGRTTVTRNLT